MEKKWKPKKKRGRHTEEYLLVQIYLNYAGSRANTKGQVSSIRLLGLVTDPSLKWSVYPVVTVCTVSSLHLKNMTVIGQKVAPPPDKTVTK